MSAGTFGRQPQVQDALFTDADKRDHAVHAHHSSVLDRAAFVQHKMQPYAALLQQLADLFCAVIPHGLFVAAKQQVHRAGRRKSLAEQALDAFQHGDQLPLHVQRAPAVYIAVLNGSYKWIVCPQVAVDGDNILMGEQRDRFQFAIAPLPVVDQAFEVGDFFF